MKSDKEPQSLRRRRQGVGWRPEGDRATGAHVQPLSMEDEIKRLNLGVCPANHRRFLGHRICKI